VRARRSIDPPLPE
jgi:hypothetical protein